MLFLVILVIVLGWAGWFWSWGRDRFESNSGIGLPPSPLGQKPVAVSPLARPRSASMARRRRREVLGALAMAALLSFLLARSWAPLWVVHVAIDVALVAYAAAVYTLERPSGGSSLIPDPRLALRRLQPVMEQDAAAESHNARPVH